MKKIQKAVPWNKIFFGLILVFLTSAWLDRRIGLGGYVLSEGLPAAKA